MSDFLLTTPLHNMHIAAGAKMVAFAGYDMPVQYPLGVKQEHLHCRAKVAFVAKCTHCSGDLGRIGWGHV